MPTESELRDLLGDPRPGTGGIDVDAVLRRARSRRRSRVVAGTAAGAFALAGVLVPVTLTSLVGGASPTALVAEEEAGDEGGAHDSDPAAPESATGSGGPTVEFAPDPTPPWRIDIAHPVGDLALCSEDVAVQTALMSADQSSSSASLTLVEDATSTDVTRVVECLLGSLAGGAITVAAPQ